MKIGFSPSITQTQDDVIWVVSDDSQSGINRFDGVSWTHFFGSDLGVSNVNTSLVETRDGRLWIAGADMLTYKNNIWLSFAENQLPEKFHRKLLLETSDGALWVAGIGEGAGRLDYDTGKWQTYQGLLFQCETPDSLSWFIDQDGGIVSSDGKKWIRYGSEDGVIDAPVRLFAAKNNILWAIGSHDSTAATARFDGKTWIRDLHPKLAWGLHRNSAVCETAEGHMWFSATVNRLIDRGQVGGLLRFTPASLAKTGEPIWTHFAPPETPSSAYGIAQTTDGKLWIAGAHGLRYFDGQTWHFPEQEELRETPCDELLSTPDGELWVGTRTLGVFRLKKGIWTQYTTREGLVDHKVRMLRQKKHGNLLALTSQGFTGFDGVSWTPYTTPGMVFDEKGLGLSDFQVTGNNTLWFNYCDFFWFDRARPNAPQGPISLYTIRHQPDGHPPRTEITESIDRISQPGNTFVFWKGTDFWHDTIDSELQFSYRLNEAHWSAFTPKKSITFFSLPPGEHIFEVKARDKYFNTETIPARHSFYVIPPIWKQSWFIGLISIFLSGIGLQTWRIVRRDRRLQTLNRELGIRVAERTADLTQTQILLQYQSAQQLVLLHIEQAVQGILKPRDLNEVLQVCLSEFQKFGLDIQTLGLHRMVDATNQSLISIHVGSDGIIWGPERRDHSVVPIQRWKEQTLYYCKNLDRLAQNEQSDPDAYLDEFRQSRFRGLPIQSMLDIPFSDGLFCVHSIKESAFSESDIEMVRRVTDILAVGVSRAKNLEELEQRETLLTQSQNLAKAGSWERNFIWRYTASAHAQRRDSRSRTTRTHRGDF